MDKATAHDIAQRFVDQDRESKWDIWEEDMPIDDEGNLFLQLQNWSDCEGERTYVDVVEYPGDSVYIGKRIEPMDDVGKIAEAIMSACEECVGCTN